MRKPYKLLTLLELMRHYNVWQLVRVIEFLNTTESLGEFNHEFRQQTPIPEDRIEYFRSMIVYARRECEHLELWSAVSRCDSFAIELRSSPTTGNEVMHQARTLREVLVTELSYRRFAVVTDTKGKTRDGWMHLWPSVWAKFPSIKEDTERALDCYILEQNTACVFHSMRIAERGLHALARERKVKLPKNRRLEWAQWNDIITEISKAADKIANRRAGPARDAALGFYRGALGEVQAFKDVYRNHVMHGRESYDEYQAASALSHILDFMKRLAEKIDENPTKSIKWGIR